jgi:hypothetical protein
MGLADLHFEKPIRDALADIWLARAELMADVQLQLQLGDAKGFQRLYGGETSAKFDALRERMCLLLKPIALPSVEP